MEKIMENITENMERILEDFKAETAIPSIVLTTERNDNIAITDSKFGGIPYLPKDYAYPTTAEGEPLRLLAQLNFSQLPKLENFPTSGILQFYVLPDGVFGLQDLPDATNGDTYRVIYHKEILPEESIMKDFSDIEIFDEEYDELFPFEGEYLINGSIVNSSMHDPYEFDNVFGLFCKKNNVAPYFETYVTELLELRKNMTKVKYEKFERKWGELMSLISSAYSDVEAHRISGYPYFTQEDPRRYIDHKEYNVLLFQMVSEWKKEENDYGISWGDCGVANFFINLEDLKNLNFQDILYTWDCS